MKGRDARIHKIVKDFQAGVQAMVDDPKSGITGISVSHAGQKVEVAKRKDAPMAQTEPVQDIPHAAFPLVSLIDLKQRPPTGNTLGYVRPVLEIPFNDTWESARPVVDALMMAGEPASVLISRIQVPLPWSTEAPPAS